jgi:hypothetical protein
MKPFYILVHKDIIWNSHPSYNEVQRIIREEEYMLLNGDSHNVDSSVPRGREIRVGGAFGELCVSFQVNALRAACYDATPYEKSILTVKDLVDQRNSSKRPIENSLNSRTVISSSAI